MEKSQLPLPKTASQWQTSWLDTAGKEAEKTSFAASKIKFWQYLSFRCLREEYRQEKLESADDIWTHPERLKKARETLAACDHWQDYLQHIGNAQGWDSQIELSKDNVFLETLISQVQIRKMPRESEGSNKVYMTRSVTRAAIDCSPRRAERAKAATPSKSKIDVVSSKNPRPRRRKALQPSDTAQKREVQEDTKGSDSQDVPSDPATGTKSAQKYNELDELADELSRQHLTTPQRPTQMSPHSPASAGSFPTAPGERVVQTALEKLLTRILLVENKTYSSWTTEEKRFQVNNGFVAITDGYLQGHEETQVLGIVEVKAALRANHKRATQMQEAAQMVAWILVSPVAGDVVLSKDNTAQSYTRVMIAQNHQEIYLIIATYSPSYVEYIRHVYQSSVHEEYAGELDDPDTFMIMREYGPFDIFYYRHMRVLAPYLLAFASTQREFSETKNFDS